MQPQAEHNHEHNPKANDGRRFKREQEQEHAPDCAADDTAGKLGQAGLHRIAQRAAHGADGANG